MFFGGGFPGSFPGMGSDDLPGSGRGGRTRKTADNTKFYKLLEVESGASQAEIKKAYRRLAVRHHPDKGGDSDMFKEIARAYEVLGDPEKRAKYDKYGEAGIEDGSGAGDPMDLFEAFFGGGRGSGGNPQRRQRTKNVVRPLKVTLEEMYSGATKKMRITRQVVNKKRGVQECCECSGRGVKVEVIRMGPMIQQMQSECRACGGKGKSFGMKQESQILEVHIQKGSSDGHRLTFREMADEHPDAETGDVVFVLREQEHADFKRKGADLFVERRISLVEALCGFQLELTHLDGRRLLIEMPPGEIVKPMPRGFDPLADEDVRAQWEILEDCDCPGIESVAQTDTTDVETLKKACEMQLKRQGIDVGAFVVDGRRAYFKQCSREEALGAKKPCKGYTTYVICDPDASGAFRMMKAVKGEGMPTHRNPFLHGNLFLLLTIEFPGTLPPPARQALRALLPPPLHTPRLEEDDPSVEVHVVTDMDPVLSYSANRVNMRSGGEAYEDDEEGEGIGGSVPVGPGVQCHQQ